MLIEEGSLLLNTQEEEKGIVDNQKVNLIKEKLAHTTTDISLEATHRIAQKMLQLEEALFSPIKKE